LFIDPKEVVLTNGYAYAQYIICNNQNAENDSTNLLATSNFKTVHPDLHFIYPTVSTEDKTKPKALIS
jgi:DNA polymerase-3 subunit delta'